MVTTNHGHSHDHGHGLRARLKRMLAPHNHDAVASTDQALEDSREGVRAIKISLSVLLFTAVVQAMVVTLTGSTALLADTIHNFSDALTALPLWIAFALARRPATRRYTYGYGRAEDLAGVLIVVTIAASAVFAGYQAVHRLIEGTEMDHPWIVMLAGIVGFCGNELVAQLRIRVGRRIGSAALVADGLHARTDGFTSLAVILGAVGVLVGYPAADPIVGLVITVAILAVLRGAFRDVYRRLMDAVDPLVTETAEAVVRTTSGVVDVEHVRLRWVGHRILADVAVVVPAYLDLVAAHDIANEAHHRLLHRVPKLSDVTIHVSPAGLKGDDHHGLLRHHAGSISAVVASRSGR